MFRLDEQISRWCKAAAERAHLSTAEIEELRDHLKSVISRQRALGASDEKAFHLAVAQLGSIGDLSREYAKNKKIGRVFSAIANIPYGDHILGLYLVAIACLMSFFHIVGFTGLFLTGAERPPDLVDLGLVAFFGHSLWMWLPFVWGGIAGVSLLRGRELGPATLFGLVALLAIQIPVFGAQPLPAFELSGGLQLTLLLGPVEGLFDYQTLPSIHINAPAAEPHYFGINLIALTAFLFAFAKFIDYVRTNEARIRAAAAIG